MNEMRKKLIESERLKLNVLFTRHLNQHTLVVLAANTWRISIARFRFYLIFSKKRLSFFLVYFRQIDASVELECQFTFREKENEFIFLGLIVFQNTLQWNGEENT